MLSNHFILCSPFSFCLQSFPALGSFPMSWLFASSGQHIGASALASVLPMNIQSWFSLELTESPRDSQESSPAPQFDSIYSLVLSLLYGPALTSLYGYWKSHSFDYMELCQRSDDFAFNMLSMFVIAFLPRSNCFCFCFVLFFNFMAAASISSGFVSQENKIWYCFHFSSWSLGLDAMILVFWMLSFKPAFSLSSFILLKSLFSSSSLSASRVISSECLRLLIFLSAILIPAWDHPVWHFTW